ncbi:hypothetical protein ACXAT3_002731 [Clostridium sporogenes]
MNINKDIFECAANSLNISELRVILQENNIPISIKDKKYEIIDKLLASIDDNSVTEELYCSIKKRAFSENSDFNEGFYYKYSNDNIDFQYDKFFQSLGLEMENNKISKYSTNTFKYHIYNEVHDENDKLIKFTFSRETRSRRYDYVDKDIKIFNERIKANIEINYEYALVYIQSRNYNNSVAIKFFLEKVINNLRVDKKSNKVKLGMPKFDNEIVNKWASENKLPIKGISSMTVHMLDLLSEFEVEDNKFNNYCMKKIFFGNEVIDTKGKNEIKGSIFYGDDIQECIEISEGIVNGKKINGFEVEVDYLHMDEESGVEPEIVQVPITILQENNNTIRIAISKEIVSVKKGILIELYESIRRVFINKLNSNRITNTDAIINFINRAQEILKKEGKQGEADEAKAVTL